MDKTINHKNLYILILGICIASFPLGVKAALILPVSADGASTRSSVPITQWPPAETTNQSNQVDLQSQDFSCIEPTVIPIGYNRSSDCIPTPKALQNKTAEQTIEQSILKTSFGAKLYYYCGKPPYLNTTQGPVSHAQWLTCAQAIQSSIQAQEATVQAPQTQVVPTPKEIMIDVSPVADTQAVNVSAPQPKKTPESKIIVPIATSTATTTKPANINRGLIHRLFGWLGF